MSSEEKTISIDRDIDVLRNMLSYIGIQFREIDDLVNQVVCRERLLHPETVDYFNTIFKPQWRELNYNTGKLTSLRKNNIETQKFPAVNMMRQILRCHKLHLKPHIQSMGYDPDTGKKRYRHEYVIGRMYNYTIRDENDGYIRYETVESTEPIYENDA